MAKAKKRIMREKRPKVLKAANVLVMIAICILVLNAIFIVVLKDTLIKEFDKIGFKTSSSSLILMGIMWLLISFFAWSINKTIKEKSSRVSMWELFILSFVALLSGRLDSGILMLIASVIYLVKAGKKK